MVQDDHVAPSICGPCGGDCCKRMPGAAFPEDFGAPDEEKLRATLTARLASGKWSIDWYNGDPRPDAPAQWMHRLERAYFLRPATIDGVDEIVDPSHGGTCAHLTPAGCSIFEDRPRGCRGVIPLKNGPCLASYGRKTDAAIAWLPFTKLLCEVALSLGRDPDAVEEPDYDWFLQ